MPWLITVMECIVSYSPSPSPSPKREREREREREGKWNSLMQRERAAVACTAE